MPSIILIRYKLDIVLFDKNERELYIWSINATTNNFFIHNEDMECTPINNIHKMIIKLVLDNRLYNWLNLNYSLKNLVSFTKHNNKTPYKCKVKLSKPRDT